MLQWLREQIAECRNQVKAMGQKLMDATDLDEKFIDALDSGDRICAKINQWVDSVYENNQQSLRKAGGKGELFAQYYLDHVASILTDGKVEAAKNSLSATMRKLKNGKIENEKTIIWIKNKIREYQERIEEAKEKLRTLFGIEE